MHPEILHQQEKLQHLFEQAYQLQENNDIDNEIKVQFVWYLCVRTSGYVESSVKTVLREYVKSKTNNISIANFINTKLKNLTPSRDQILELVGQFNEKWKESLKKTVTVELGDSLRSIVINRNNIAHGDDVRLSLEDLKKYFDDAQKVVELVYNECN